MKTISIICKSCGVSAQTTKPDGALCLSCFNAAKRRPAKERFSTKYEVAPNGCWEWTASKFPDGYGSFDTRRAHREAYKLFVGPIDAGVHVLHRCDNPPCVNPDHLFLGSHKDNMVDKTVKGRGKNYLKYQGGGAACKNGHAFYGENIYQSPSGRRQCRVCKNAYSRAYWVKHGDRQNKSAAEKRRLKKIGGEYVSPI